MADANGMKHEFQGQRFADTEALNAALAAHLGLETFPEHHGRHGGKIMLQDGSGGYVQRFSYERVDGVDVVTPVEAPSEA